VTFFGAVNAIEGALCTKQLIPVNKRKFFPFLKQVLKHYPNQTIAMVVDNARIHRSELIKYFLKEEDRLVFIPLPPYSPNLNPIGRL
jgi:transposase